MWYYDSVYRRFNFTTLRNTIIRNRIFTRNIIFIELTLYSKLLLCTLYYYAINYDL